MSPREHDYTAGFSEGRITQRREDGVNQGRSEDDQRQQERLYSTTDAKVWAAEFMYSALRTPITGAHVGAYIDEDFMVTWFANAIENAKKHALRNYKESTIIDTVINNWGKVAATEADTREMLRYAFGLAREAGIL